MQKKNQPSFFSRCLAIHCIWEVAHSEEKHKQPLACLCWCVWACARLSNLPISPRDTVVSSQSSFSFSGRWAQERVSEQIVSLLPCSLGSGRVCPIPARPSRITGQSLFDPAALRLSNANAASWRERNTTALLSGFIPNILHALSSFSYEHTQVCKSTQLTTTKKMFIFDRFCYWFCRVMLLNNKKH